MRERPLPPLFELTVARLKEFLREPEALFWVFAFPVLLALALGVAFRGRPPERIPVGVLDGPEAAATRSALARSPALLPRPYPEREGREALRTGRISLLVEPGASPVYRFDPTRPDARVARLEVDDALQRAAGRKDPLAPREERVAEKGARYIDFLLPGLVGLNLMGTGMWSIGFSIVTARTKKLLKRLVATPMRRRDYLLSQMLARLVFLGMEVAVVVGFGWVAFGVAVRGSILLLALVCLVGAASFAGLGLLVAARARTIEAVSGLMNVVMLPMWLLSGVFFSSDRFPDALRPFIRALPLTALNDALRAVVNEAKGFPAIASELLVLLLWGGLSFAAALRVFRWR
ncbi:ABC transporter permease [Acidobacteria bacterium ACD]|nr:ABC transporter permease [Acidobacteria bacterium ACD]